jgi:hypothetical protein
VTRLSGARPTKGNAKYSSATHTAPTVGTVPSAGHVDRAGPGTGLLGIAPHHVKGPAVEPRTATALQEICAAHSHLHRKQEDLLAEYLLEQRADRDTQTRS